MNTDTLRRVEAMLTLKRVAAKLVDAGVIVGSTNPWNTVRSWWKRGHMPDADLVIDGRPRWHEKTIDDAVAAGRIGPTGAGVSRSVLGQEHRP